MKKLTLAFFIAIFTTLAFSQARTVYYKDFRVDGLCFRTNKQDLLKKFGKPIKVFKPNYECGFLSDSQPGGTHYSMQYSYITFTGNTLNYQLEEVLFNPKMKHKITYKNLLLSYKTTIKEFERMFAVKVTENKISIFYKNSDDALVFSFAGGLLSKITYWSPC
ncbi:hypothetical protein ABIB40_001699 [Pedobacter sp. UYP30]|uniref:hypothetical protein n=1 Tax=Pedobacter sp. UYP30 TaxID=1756400 RepID=UPI003392A4C3